MNTGNSNPESPTNRIESMFSGVRLLTPQTHFEGRYDRFDTSPAIKFGKNKLAVHVTL